jgi:hypothetical protein
VPHQRDQVAVATGLDPQDPKPNLGIVVRDALDQSGEQLPVRWLGFHLHDGTRDGRAKSSNGRWRVERVGIVPGIMNRRQDRMWLCDSNDSSFYRRP